MGANGGGKFELELLREVQRKIKKRQCFPEECREAELATLARTDMAEIRGMSRSQVLVKLDERSRHEGLACRIKKRGCVEPWQKGLCRRYGAKVFHFIPFADTGKLDRFKREAVQARKGPEFTPYFEKYLEERIGLVLVIGEYDILNEFEWALEQTGAQVQRTEQQLGRLRADMKKLGNAYRRLLTSRSGGARDR